MVELGDQDQQPFAALRVVQAPDHVKALGDAREAVREAVERRRCGSEPEDRPHEETLRQRIAEVRGFGDEGVVVGKEAGDGGDDAGAVGAGDGQGVKLLAFLHHPGLPV